MRVCEYGNALLIIFFCSMSLQLYSEFLQIEVRYYILFFGAAEYWRACLAKTIAT